MGYIDRYAVILAGGNGTRLWPLSREVFPKQLVPLKNGKNLMQLAYERIGEVVPYKNKWICGSAKYKSKVFKNLPNLAKYIGEPLGRETLPAIALCCALAEKENPESIISFFPSDHIIQPVEKFQKALLEAYLVIENDNRMLITFGIFPTYASTAYGYLELGFKKNVGSKKLRVVNRFYEKPEKIIAEKYFLLGKDKYLWNSGIFIWKAKTFLKLLNKYEPEIESAIMKIVNQKNYSARSKVMNGIYPTIKKKSVDYGIMEPASHDPEVQIGCIPLDIKWKDIGSWTAYGSLARPDKVGNVSIYTTSNRVIKNIIFQESTKNLVVSSEKSHLIACLGCEDLVVVHTSDATLICHKSKVEDIKKLYNQLGKKYK